MSKVYQPREKKTRYFRPRLGGGGGGGLLTELRSVCLWKVLWKSEKL